ncbi:MAG: DUF2384 domain-containing protein [Sphingomonadaceae bacterium]|nr:DUF2384 domain-containing protein [Sphingomonadaceae bacterium]
MATAAFQIQTQDDQILTSAVSKVADFWGLSNAKLGTVLGLSPATVSRLRSGNARLDPASKSFEAGQFLLRLFRSLDAIMGSDDVAVRSWLAAPNLDLEGRPLDLIDSFKGLMTVCDYVDAHRARV